MSECYVNLNTHGIFGMAILEAMYYENAVIALRAPGPELIIEDGVSGYLCDSEEELLETVKHTDRQTMGTQAKKRVLQYFIWENSVKKMSRIIDELL